MGKFLNSKILMTLIILVGFMLTVAAEKTVGEGDDHTNLIRSDANPIIQLKCPKGQEFSKLQNKCHTPSTMTNVVG
jgi:hypothetical protein